MHLDEERAQRLLHGELAAAEEASVRAHLADCSDCRDAVVRLGEEENRIFARLKLLDRPGSSGPVSAEAVMARGAARSDEWRRWAAVVVVAIGIAGAAYAIPGSPWRRWIDGIAPRAAPPQAPQAPKAVAEFAGVAVAPGPRLAIVFTRAESRSRVVVRVVDGGEVVVRAPSGAATYTSDVGRVVVDNGSAAEFEVAIPRSAARVEIRVGATILFVREGGRSRASGPLEGNGPFTLSLGGS